jgi:hypothetical protein
MAHDLSMDVQNLFHVAWKGNFEPWLQDPLYMRHCSCNLGSSFWSTCRGSLYSRRSYGPVIITNSEVYQWWYTIRLHIIEDIYTGTLFLLYPIHNRGLVNPNGSQAFVVEKSGICLNHHLSGLCS